MLEPAVARRVPVSRETRTSERLLDLPQTRDKAIKQISSVGRPQLALGPSQISLWRYPIMLDYYSHKVTAVLVLLFLLFTCYL